jgi:DNA-directed RNA polymerase specialized sigma24 family protein
MAPDDSSVSDWLGRLPSRDEDAVQKLWERYFARLVGLARVKLGDMPRRVADEEDVALSAFKSFCHEAALGRFPRLEDREDLWRLLVTITARKAYQLRLHLGRRKRGGLLDEAAPNVAADTGSGKMSLAQFISREPTPEFAAQAAEEYERLLALLPSAGLRSLAQWKLEGYTNQEIADRLDCGLRSVERRLRLIRSRWGPEVDED